MWAAQPCPTSHSPTALTGYTKLGVPEATEVQSKLASSVAAFPGVSLGNAAAGWERGLANLRPAWLRLPILEGLIANESRAPPRRLERIRSQAGQDGPVNIVAGVVGAVLSLVGVLLGVWLNARREERKWLRDNKLQHATEFIASAGQLYNHRRRADRSDLPQEVLAEWDDRVQRSRAAIHLLCERPTIDRMEALSKIVWAARVDDPEQHEQSTRLLRDFTEAVRCELVGRQRRAGKG